MVLHSMVVLCMAWCNVWQWDLANEGAERTAASMLRQRRSFKLKENKRNAEVKELLEWNLTNQHCYQER